jgi:hypothetical protein
MARMSVSDFQLFLNNQVKVQEKIETCLWRLEALMAVATMTESFYELPENILHNYFSLASDLIEEAAKANQTSLYQLLIQSHPTLNESP